MSYSLDLLNFITLITLGIPGENTNYEAPYASQQLLLSI
jgi:hypothetical protein